jgi:hypothetical protein
LSKINNKAKVRYLTKSQVLGKAKVISYEDLEEARAKRIEKEKAAEAKAKRGCKRKTPTLVVNILESRIQVTQLSEEGLAGTLVELIREIPGLWRALVAQMILKSY